MMKKRIVAFFLCIALCVGFIPNGAIVHAEDSASTSTNIAMLESLLNERSWVLDTLVENDYSTNPYVMYSTSTAKAESMMAQVLSSYQDESDPNYSATYKFMIDVMEKVYNKDDYLGSLSSYIEDFFSWFSDEDSASGVVNDLVASVDELRYESMMYEVLSADYTTSSGETLSDIESQLLNVRRMQETLSGLNAMLSFLKSSITSASGSAAEDAAIEAYINDFMLPYISTIGTFTDEFATVQQSSVDQDALDAMLYAYALMNMYESYAPTDSVLQALLSENSPTYYLSETTLAIIKAAGKTVSIASTAVDSYSFLAVMALQGESIAGPITRMASMTKDDDLESALTYVAQAIADETEESIQDYETMVNAVRQTNTISTLVVTPIVSAAVKALTEKVFGVSSKTVLSSTLTKASTLVGITSWCADAAVGLEETCKKTYELLVLEDLIDQAVDVYETDLLIYQIDPTDANAQNVIDDLMLLQKMRLRGETIAHEMTVNQLDSVIGQLLGGGKTLEYREALYQTMVDAIIGASVLSMPTEEVTVASGETLTIKFGDDGELYGVVKKDDDNYSYVVAELAYTAMSGIVVKSGGAVVIGQLGSTDTATVRYLPSITNSGGEVTYFDSTMKMTEYQQSGGTLTLFTKDTSASYEIETFTIASGTIVGAAQGSYSLDITDFTSSGTVDCGGVPLYISGDASIAGTLSDTDVTLDGSAQQTLSAVTLKTLYIQNTSSDGVLIASDISVTESIRNTSSKLINGQKITLTGSLLGSVYNGGITLDGVMIPDGMQINGLTYLKNGVSATNATFLSSVVLSSGSFVVTQSLTAAQDIILRGDAFAVAGTLYLSGDIYDATGTDDFEASIGTLICNAQSAQTIECALAVTHFYNNNTSQSGVSVLEDVSVTQNLRSLSSPIEGDATLQVYATTQFLDDVIYADFALMESVSDLPSHVYGNVTLSENTQETQMSIDVSQAFDLHGDLYIETPAVLTVDAPMTIDGDLQVNADATLNFNDDVLIGGDLQIANVAVTIEGADETTLQLKNLYNSGTLTLLQDVVIINDFINYKTISADGTIILYGDINNLSTMSLGTLQLITKLDKFILGSAFTVENLTIVGGRCLELQAVITVSGALESGEASIINPENIICDTSTSVESTVYGHTVYATGDFIVESGETVVINGGLIASGDVIVQAGASLLVTQKVELTAASTNVLQVAEDAQLCIGGYAILETGTITIDGTLQAESDVIMDASSISGIGQLILFEDLYCEDSGIDVIGTLALCGKAPQEIEGSITAAVLRLQNTSRGGITLYDEIYYSDTLEDNGTALSGTILQK